MQAVLRVTSGGEEGQIFSVGAGEKLVLGRDPNCEVQLASDTVSRFHLMVECRDGRYFLSDLHSGNGTYVNGVKVIHKELFPGDTIRAGDAEFQFQASEEAPKIDSGTETTILLTSRPEEMIRKTLDVREDEFLAKDQGADPTKHLQIIQSLSTIYRIGNSIHGERDLGRLFHTIMDTILSVVKADRGFLIMMDKTPDVLKPVVVRTKSKNDKGLVLTLSKTIVRETLQRGQAILCSDTMSDARFRVNDSVLNFGIKSVMCVPLVSQKTILGAIYLDSVKRAGVFTEQEFELIVAIGKQAGIAIERTLLERENETTKRHLECVFQSVPVGIVTLDPGGTVSGWSTHNEKLFGISKEEAVGKLALADLLRDPAAGPHVLEQVASGGSFEGELVLKARDGHEFPANVGMVPLMGSDAVEMGFSCTIQDISRQKELQKQMVRQEKMAAVGLLAAGISHEFNNLLGSMSGFAQLAKRNPKHLDQLVDIVIAQTKRAETITRNLLSFSRPKAEARETANLVDVVENILKLIEKELNQLNITVKREFQAIPNTLVNVGAIEEVFLNLFINARQAIGRNGAIEAGMTLEGENIVIRISDTGRGIPKENIDKIFDPFFTTKGFGQNGEPLGTGLGLNLVANIVKDHKGEISVKSVIGKRTTFTISLPIVEGPKKKSLKRQKTRLPIPKVSRRILVVDDEKPILDLFDGMLAGHRVTLASCGEDALTHIHKDNFDFIFMDVLMAGELDGFDLFDEIEALGSRSKVYFVTARRMDDRLLDYSNRACGIIKKPFNLDDILEVVNA
ncbi:MAG: ATP-binding protein [Planctomycetota bacterium]|nr:ATP-binding protein [Planctomycetota bacterium]